MRKLLSALTLGTLFAAHAPADAATQAYWRFEDKNGLPALAGDTLVSDTPGGSQANGDIVDTTSDSSGNGNFLRVFHSPNDPNSPNGVDRLETSPAYTLNTPTLVVPQTGSPNLFAFDFDSAPGSDAPAPPDAGGDDVFTRDSNDVLGPISSVVFPQYTIEGAFRAERLNAYQSIVVKDGSVGDGGGIFAGGPLPAFVVKIFNNNTLNIETFDGSGGFRAIAADSPIVADQWYKFAVVNDGTTLQLYLDSGAGYVLQNQQAAIFGGALYSGNVNAWAIGRGWFAGANDWFDGQIDEIRLSDVALSPDQFLFAVPEPATWTLAATLAFGLAAVSRRRRLG